MSQKSFYDLDYIIEINEKRAEEYTSAYQKVQERLTNIILIYSGIAIFLVPIVQGIALGVLTSYWLFFFFAIFLILFAVSVFYTVKLIIPVKVAYLDSPEKYYTTYRFQYEQTLTEQSEIDKLLKASYIGELEEAVKVNNQVFKRKSSFYYNALMYALLSVVPFLLCVGFQISKKEDTVQKVEIVNSIKK